MLVTPLPMVTLVRLRQFEKALSSMVMTPLPMVTVVRLVQLLKAKLPMVVTLSVILGFLALHRYERLLHSFKKALAKY
jgi:hypothetical protein